MPNPRLRFAPSPTGFLHVGGARTALFNWLYAKKHGGTFLLRVEDTDKARSTDESTRAIFDGLTWLGLNWAEDVVYQGANVARHRADAERLLASGHAYRDFTTADELETMRQEAKARGDVFRFDRGTAELTADQLKRRLDAGLPYAIRFRVPDGETSWDDLVHGTITFPNRDIEDFIILRSDGTPVYNHAVVSDDIAMRITHVMRGDDHISNTPKQILLYRALGAELPVFAHLPMIHGADGKKLSKRTGAAAVSDWQHRGILPSAMVNFLSLLGWSPGNDIELMSRAELIELFDASHLLKKPSVFDEKKLEWMNGQHIQRTSNEDLFSHALPLLASEHFPAAWWEARREHVLMIVDTIKMKVRTTIQLAEQITPIVAGPSEPDAAAQKVLSAPSSAQTLRTIRDALAGIEGEWSVAAVHEVLHGLPEQLGVKPGEVFQPLRAALTGSLVSPEINALVYFVGQDEVVRRIDRVTGRI